MYLTKERSVELSKPLWEWLANTGKFKLDWHGWTEHNKYIRNHCFMCDYSIKQCKRRLEPESCNFCPYFMHYHITCTDEGSSFTKWSEHRSDTDASDRKLYAREFLAELEGIVV